MTDQNKAALDAPPHKLPMKTEDIFWLEKFIKDQCNNDRQWTMSVPVQNDDSDMVLCRILNHLKANAFAEPAPPKSEGGA